MKKKFSIRKMQEVTEKKSTQKVECYEEPGYDS